MYTKFMKNVFEWLPFKVDDQTSDISRKWCTYNGMYEYTDGDLIDAMLFIPDTKKENEQHQLILNNQHLTNLERWFTLNMETGNRNNMLLKYGYMLLDGYKDLDYVQEAVINLNSKLSNKLTDDEINNTIMISLHKKAMEKGINV